MSDPLSQIVTMLQPRAAFSKLVIAGGSWAVRRTDDGRPFYCAVLDGVCRLETAGQEPIELGAGDFAFVPASFDVTTSDVDTTTYAADPIRKEISPGVFRLGLERENVGVRMLIGHCAFVADEADMLIALLPRLTCVREEPRLAVLAELIADEYRQERPGRDAILSRLLEALLIEALRAAPLTRAAPGLLRGLDDARLAAALRSIHTEPDRSWSVPELAREAGLSRSAFFERFGREVGVTPMEYLLGWRMTLARDLLGDPAIRIAEVANRLGYRSASTFSVAFTRHTGIAPSHYSRRYAQ